MSENKWSYVVEIARLTSKVEIVKKEEISFMFNGMDFILSHPSGFEFCKEVPRFKITNAGKEMIRIFFKSEVEVENPYFDLQGNDSTFGVFEDVSLKVYDYRNTGSIIPTSSRQSLFGKTKVFQRNVPYTQCHLAPSNHLGLFLNLHPHKDTTHPSKPTSGFINWLLENQRKDE